MGTSVIHKQFFYTPTPYKKNLCEWFEKKIDELQKRWEWKFQEQDNRFKAMMDQFFATQQSNISSSNSYASQVLEASQPNIP